MADTERKPEPGEVYEWTDANDLNQLQCRRLPGGGYLVIAGHGPRGPQRRYTSIVLPDEVASDLADALVESLAVRNWDACSTAGRPPLISPDPPLFGTLALDVDADGVAGTP